VLVQGVYNKKIIFWSQIFSSLFYPYFKIINYFRPIFDLDSLEIKTILVTEYHRIGDVLIIEPVLRSIKKKYPNAHLILICNENVENLARYLGLADEVIPINAPWTNWSWSVLKWWRVRSFAKQLSSRQIDLAFDFKGDLRNGWFLWLTYPKVSFGYDTTGGGYFFTNPIKMNQGLHQLDRAEKMVSKIGCQLVDRQNTPQGLNDNGAVVLHVGATDQRRSWPTKNWITLVDMLSNKFKTSIVETNESKQLIEQLKKTNSQVEYYKGDLIEFTGWLAQQKCLVCPDSMAGHLAAYVQIPVVSLFGSQAPELTSPVTNLGVVVKPERPCDHKSNHWRLCRKCMESISPLTVYGVIYNHIDKEIDK
tara:strand:- start:183 stop:1274 length:1092 start_codon:yes stop_codon:yes gene_type:complete